jgi:hypothetical protein
VCFLFTIGLDFKHTHALHIAFLDKIRKRGNDVEVYFVRINIVYQVRTWVKLVSKTINKNNSGVIDFSNRIPCNGRAAIYHLCFETSPLFLFLHFPFVRFLEAPLSVFLSRDLCDSPFNAC